MLDGWNASYVYIEGERIGLRLFDGYRPTVLKELTCKTVG